VKRLERGGSYGGFQLTERYPLQGDLSAHQFRAL
jgi:hypothetical protein